MNRIVGRQILGLLGLLAASLLLFSASAGSVGQQDSVPSIKSKDAGERLAALHALVEAAGEDLSPLLIKMLKDKDWEIVAVAARALGDGSNPKAIKPLTSLALSGPIREVRLVATAALAKLDPDAAAQALIKKVRKESLAACEALVVLGPSLENFEVPKALWKLLEDKQLRVRSAASGAILALSHEQRVEVLKRLLASEYLGVRARALEVAERQPQWSALVVLNTLLQQPDLDPVLLRRAMPAVVATLLVKEKGAEFQDAGDLTELFSGSKKDLAEGLVKGLCHNPEAVVARRGPLLAELLLRAEWESRPDMIAATEAARNHNDPGVRAGAVRLLRFVAGHDSIHLCQELYESDRSPRVKRTAIESLLFIQPVSESASWRWIVERLASETVSELRQRLVVALGNQELAEKEDVLKALVTACDDLDWGVAACAAVSLGITRSPRAPEALNALVKTSEDWRLRGAAVVGLSKCLQKDAIMGVIAALEDTEPLVARTALTYLKSVNRGQSVEPSVEAWSAWWESHRDKIRLLDPKEQQKRNTKYGYAASPDVIYRDLDVLVLESRGDQIQVILGQLGIAHRMTMAGKLETDGLEASGVFISNCTGEMAPQDIERLDWFVKVGGYLCGSCWALSETIERIEPGVLSKFHTRDEVLDTVIASPCDPDSQFTAGVFGEYVQPLYRLEGAHLIDVLQPERVEMLVDSVECAEKWGSGNLACWFSSGHGTILDSTNHFHGQGLQNALGLKKPEQRMAYAMDHMGTSFERIRETAKEKYWGSNHTAAQNILDYSVFNLVTNFVRLRRLEGR